MTLAEAMPYEYLHDSAFDNEKAHKFDSVEVVWKQDVFNKNSKPWIGKHKNVHFWVLLKNGYAVGWNENPSIGWSFPCVKAKGV